MSRDERRITRCNFFDAGCWDERGVFVEANKILGSRLAFETRHRIHIFFVGIGDADLEVGPILAEATGSEFRGVTERDLATVLEEFGKYF